jgi:hypothetical protein
MDLDVALELHLMGSTWSETHHRTRPSEFEGLFNKVGVIGLDRALGFRFIRFTLSRF